MLKRNFLSEEAIFRIRALNTKLREKELQLIAFRKTLLPVLEQAKAENRIDDFNFDYGELILFYRTEEEEEVIWEDKTWLLSCEEKALAENWNEFFGRENHPLKDEWFCCTMHSIVFHSGLSWKKILKVNDVWLQLKVDYQFFAELK